MLIQPKILTISLFAWMLFSYSLDAKSTIPGSKSSFGFVSIVTPSVNGVNLTALTEQDRKTGGINFQINSDITYFNINQFKKPESKQIFMDAWSKSRESRKLTHKTDSLRKAYSDLADEQKDKIAALIIEGEKKILALNEEIPGLFEKARQVENLYWQSVSIEEKTKFAEQIKSYRDSIQQLNVSAQKSSSEISSVPDTIIYYRVDKLNEVASEPVSTVVYKIQVGSFKTKLPESIAKAIKKLEILRKVDITKDEKGVTYYSTGNLKSYKEALTLQTQVKLEGIKNPSVVAYKNNIRIALDEAKKLTNETDVKP